MDACAINDWTRRHLYVAELASGVIKIGMSRSPRKRRYSLELKVGKLRKFHVVEHPIAGPMVELALANRLKRVANVLHGREWFTGIRFSDALHLARQFAKRDGKVGRKSSSLASVSTLEGREFPGAVSDQVAGAGSFIRGDELLHDSSFFTGSTIKETVGSIDCLDKR